MVSLVLLNTRVPSAWVPWVLPKPSFFEMGPQTTQLLRNLVNLCTDVKSKIDIFFYEEVSEPINQKL